MPPAKLLLPMVGSLVAISLGSTVTALALQSYFGRLPVLVLVGQALAVVGSALFALKTLARP